MTPKHTQGEWIINKHSVTTVEVKDSNRSIASTGSYQVNTKDAEQVYNENIANAKLIVAAPDLLEALNEFLNIINRSPAALHHYGNAIEKAEAAIKKATE